MKPADQPNAIVLSGPEGCEPLPVVRVRFSDEEEGLVSAWELSEQDVKDVVATGRVWLTVLGNVQTPVSLTTRCPYGGDPLDEAPGEADHA